MQRVLLLGLAAVLGSALLVYAENKCTEQTATVGCAKCTFAKETGATDHAAAARQADGKVVLLTGDAVKAVKFEAGGKYVIKGTLSQDGKSLDVVSIAAAKGG